MKSDMARAGIAPCVAALAFAVAQRPRATLRGHSDQPQRAGGANSSDAMSMTINPARLVDVDRLFNLGLSLFAPTRRCDATSGTLFVAPGGRDSSITLVLNVNAAYSQTPVRAED